MFTTSVPAASLRAGTNSIAVKVFQDDNTNTWSVNPTFFQAKLAVSVGGTVPVEDAPPGTQQLKNGATGGDPVQTFSGAFLYSRVDVAIAGRGPTPSFARSYNSADTRIGPMGPGWMHAYGARLRSPGDASADLLFVGPDGSTDRFTANPDGTFSPPPAAYRTLVRNADGSFVVTEKSLARWTFNAAGSLTAITDRHGNTSTLGYNGAGELVSISDPAGRGSLTLTYTAGRLTSVTDWAQPARTVAYGYDASGRLSTVTDREGRTTTFTYDGTSSRLTTITDARANVALTLTYDAAGRVATQKDAAGLVTGATTTFGYVVNPDGTRVTTVTAPPTSFEPSFSPTIVDSYAANGWLTQRVARPSSTETLTETYTYDAIGNRTSVTDPRGNRTDLCYDVTAVGGPTGSRGNLTRRIDPAPTSGAARPVTLITYDAFDNPVQTVSPRGVASTSTTTCLTDLTGAINPQYVTDLAYDATGARLLSTTSRFTDPDLGPQVAVTKYEYGDPANPGAATRVIPPRGNTTPTPDATYAVTSTYFGPGFQAGMLASVADAFGNTTTYTYDAVGRQVSVVDPLGNAAGGVPAEHRTDYGYDNEDRLRFVRLPAPVAGGAQLVTESRYDEVGNPVVRIDAAGQVTASAYDERDSLLQVRESPVAWTDPALPPANVITTEYAYDAGGNLTRMTRAKGDAAAERVTDYAYDGRGLVRRETQYPAWPTTSPTLVATSAYDPAGNLAVATDQLGRTTTYTYDALNRPVSIDYSDAGTPDVTYTYDPAGNRTAMTDGTGASSYAYDELDRLLSVTSPGPRTVAYRYDLDGNRTKLIYPDLTAVTYTFDRAGRLVSLQDWAGRSATYEYRPDGALKTTTNPDASVATYAYDNARRLTDILNQQGTTTTGQYAYALDAVGNVTGLQEFVSGLTLGSPPWSTAAVLNDDQTNDQYSPDIAIGADGAAYAVWTDTRTGDSDVYYSRRDPVTGIWSPNERVVAAIGSQYDPAVAVDGSNNVYVIWEDSRVSSSDEDIYFSKRVASSGAWSPSVRVNSDGAGNRQGAPDIAVTPSGAAVAVWFDPRGGASKKNIYSARLAAGGSTWSANVRVTSNQTAYKFDPKVVIDSTGTAAATWTDRRTGNDDVYFASLASGSSSWSANVKVSDDPGTATQEYPDIGVDAAGNLTAIWRDARTSPANVRASRRLAGSSTWGPSVVVGGAIAESTSLSVRSDGLAYVAWQEGAFAGPKTISGSQYDPATGSWSASELLADNGLAPGRVAVALDASEKLVFFEGRGTNGSLEVYWRGRPFSGGGTDTLTYGYDRLSRLTSVIDPDGNRTYGYDPVGNRTTMVLGDTTTSTYDRADRITAVGTLAVSVNPAGDLTARGADTFTYDQANRLTTATVAGVSETYTYDGDGVRFSRQVGAGPLIRYVTDPAVGLPVTIDDGVRKYVWGLGLVYAVSGNTLEVFHTDRLGSVRAITDAAGAITATYRTDEFGLPTATTGTTTQPFAFTGEPRDATGLTYLRARYYDPSLGRFLSRDTWPGSLAAPQSLDRYAYVGNNPATDTDPSGWCLQLEAGGLLLAPVTGGTSAVVGTPATVACGVAVGALFVLGAAAAWVTGSAAGEALADLSVRDQRFDKPIPPIRDDWRQVVRYQPEIHQYPPGKDPIGPKGPGRKIRWKILLGTLGITVVAKSLVLRPR